MPLFRPVPIFSVSSDQISRQVNACTDVWAPCSAVGSLWTGLPHYFNTVAQKDPEAQFEVVTRDDAETVRAALDIDGKLGDRLSIFPSASESVHEALQKQSTSVMFFTSGTSKLGSAPTRLGEALGCGVPVVANEGVGDVADIIRRYNVGVIVKDGSEAAMTIRA